MADLPSGGHRGIMVCPVLIFAANLVFSGCSRIREDSEAEAKAEAVQRAEAEKARAEQAAREKERAEIRQKINRFAREQVPESRNQLQDAHVHVTLLEKQLKELEKVCEETGADKSTDPNCQEVVAALEAQKKQCADLEEAINALYRADLAAKSRSVVTPKNTENVQQSIQELHQLRQELVPEPTPKREEKEPERSFWEELWEW